ncbi:hypothetical protein BABINDRAFT_163108 [Babjeviella inositovora NRRL Y-12698]|uniref:ML-like domain-containing protein n=1 Tax=Babjeviella inositovora NRRL Y-12698 TaxID=984486 RepID=A0A1E3QK70_9ASCO|nr:uncharacterized protein BABINDRAFT_163108 [Babjeviella inositovora NRRL Y-12698]ODQ78083.1 hypothetical protein BABINDRAFT_163108 [Babjeviella inositovora NRRL Y-12698]
MRTSSWMYPAVLLAQLLSVHARLLSASSLVTCMENSQLSPSFFNVLFVPENKALYYNLVVDAEISGYILAYAEVYAYGFKIIEKEINVCNLGWKQFCPIYPGKIAIDSVAYISDEYTSQIPGIAYTVPDIDAIAKIRITNSTGQQIACLQATFTNGKTVSHVGVQWVTAVIAGLGLLASALLSTFGNSNAASHISANAVSLFLYFQNVVIVSMMHVEVLPPIASAWSENLAWSMGLIRTEFMQKIFRWYIQATGGTPDLFMTSQTKSVLVQRGLDRIDLYEAYTSPGSLFKRAAYQLQSNVYLVIYRGIQRLGYKAGIESSSICVTGFTWFILFAWVIAGVFFIFRYSLELGFRFGWFKRSQATNFRLNWLLILKGSLQRYIYIGFTQLVILSLWQFFQRDSPAVVFLACVFLVFVVSILGWACFRTLKFGRESIQKYNNPAAKLYGDQRILDKYGFFYTMFNAQKYWFGAVILGYSLAKSMFIGLAQDSGKTQALAVFILDLAFLIVLLRTAPYLNRWTNCVNYAMAAVNLFNSLLFLFFSDLFGQPAAVGSIMAWLFFIVNAAFSVFLLFAIIYTVVMVFVSKNPDARFAPVRDDRTAFQRKHSVKNATGQKVVNEQTAALMALGAAAQTHTQDWENEIYRLKDISQTDFAASNEKLTSNHYTPDVSDSPPMLMAQNFLDRTVSEQQRIKEAESEGQENNGGFIRKLTRGKSLKRTKSSADSMPPAKVTASPERTSPFHSPEDDMMQSWHDTPVNPPRNVRRVSDTLTDQVNQPNYQQLGQEARITSFNSGLTADDQTFEPVTAADVIGGTRTVPHDRRFA